MQRFPQSLGQDLPLLWLVVTVRCLMARVSTEAKLTGTDVLQGNKDDKAFFFFSLFPPRFRVETCVWKIGLNAIQLYYTIYKNKIQYKKYVHMLYKYKQRGRFCNNLEWVGQILYI